jgi:hypothetical protein
VKKLNVMAVMVAAALGFGQSASADIRVLGERLDSGLGELPASYTAAEYMPAGWVRGESQDSGLGDLPATYTAAEYMPAGWVRGEKLDSGLGELSPTYEAAEFMPVMVTARRAVER